MMDVRRPLLRYHGGKWRIAPWIISFFPPHRVYVELFGSGGSVLLRKGRAYEEIYSELYQGWKKCRRNDFSDGLQPRTEVLWMKGVEPDLFSGMEVL